MTDLVVDRFGAYLGKHSERLRVTVKGQVVDERPLLDLEHVLVLSRGVSISTDAIRECATRGIPISILESDGEPVALLYSSALVGTVRTRREQLMAYEDERGLRLAKAFVVGKLGNQAVLLKYMAKYRHQRNPALYSLVREAAFEVEDFQRKVRELPAKTVDDARESLLSIEGHASKLYWQALRGLLPADVDWPGRETRGALDTVNSALNYGYGILYGQVQRALILAGLDPFGGYLHVDRPGKPSLTLDLIEEFRQAVVDRSIVSLLNLGVHVKAEDGRLDDASRRKVADAVLERLDTAELMGGQRRRLRSVLQSQARAVASFVRGDVPAYAPYVGKW